MTEGNSCEQASLKVAIVDDAYGPPIRDSVKSSLEEFCAAVEEHDAAEILQQTVGMDFLDPALVDDDAISALFKHRATLTMLAEDLDGLFTHFLRRRQDLAKIAEGIERFNGVEIVTFASLDAMRDCDKLDVVFLDYRLREANESRAIARQVYEKHRSFLVLMSDQPGLASHEETFRKNERLLRGFFRYVPKEQLVDPDIVYRTMLFVPENRTVCHAIHDLIDSLELTLGGRVTEVEQDEIEDPPRPGQAVGRFMNVVRKLPLQDYALLCELTLADEGHPLGDYIRRLFGSHLMEQVFTTSAVTRSLKELDKLRFMEFLPLAAAPSDSLKELYAASLLEPITDPWGEHPWESEPGEGDDTD